MTKFLRRVSRITAFLLLVAQLGFIAHRIEHYLVPEAMECGEDSCASFAPVADPPALPPLVAPPLRIAYTTRFWTVRATDPVERYRALGFRAHAPPA
jgi:hypothetical protein